MNRLICLLPLILTACAVRAELSPADQLRHDVFWLADDQRQGRYPGTAGADASADYIAARFRELGLSPLPGNGYRQRFTMPGRTSIREKTSLAIGHALLGVQQDFVPLSFSSLGKFEGKPAFAGYGAVSAPHGYDDYAGLDVKGRVVIAMRDEPHNAEGKSRFTNGRFTAAATLPQKAWSAYARGATASLLMVNPPRHHPKDPPLRPFDAEGARFIESPIPVLSITPAVAERLIGRPLIELQELIDAGVPRSFTIDGPNIRGEVDLEIEQLATSNVAAVLPGVGPLASEYVVVGAHYDHLGRGHFASRQSGKDAIHNGADDNASGVAAMLALAHRLKQHPLPRSIFFVAFSGEEQGLYGSRAFVSDPPVPLGRIAAMLNLDMVGRVREQTLMVGGSGTRAAFRRMLRAVDDRSPLQLRNLGDGGLGSSDHESFARERIPVLFFFSGLHEQYHQPDDDAALINFAGLQRVVDLTADLIQEIAAAPREPYIDKHDGEPERLELTPLHPHPPATTGPSAR